MCPFFSLLPLSCEKAQSMEWDCQELGPHIPHHHGQGRPREVTTHHISPSRVGALAPLPYLRPWSVQGSSQRPG